MIMIQTESNVTRTNPRSKSLRTTIPKEIITALHLEHGSKLNWKIETKNDEMYIVVEKINNE